MPAIDLAAKVSLLIGDFWAVEALATAIDHEFEKRIVARSGLLKLDSLLLLARQYKNEIRDGLAPTDRLKTRPLEQLLARLAHDHTDAIGKARDVLSAHQLLLTFGSFGELWLFMNSDVFGVLRLDLEDVDRELQSVGPTYQTGSRPPSIPGAWRDAWIKVLGSPTETRLLSDFGGFWNPGTAGFVFGHSQFQNHNALTSGLSSRLYQTIKLATPMVEAGPESRYRRLLAELLVADLCSLEELLYSGNSNDYGISLPPLSDVWRSDKHGGAPDLLGARAHLPRNMAAIRSVVRNKIACHVDPSTPAADLELSRWPVDVQDLMEDIPVFLEKVYMASRKDPRTMPFFSPPQRLRNAAQIAPMKDLMSWNTPTQTQPTAPDPPDDAEGCGGSDK